MLSSVNEDLVAQGGRLTMALPVPVVSPEAGIKNIIKATPGRLCKVLVTAAGTGTGEVLFYDNELGNAAGTVIGVVPATVAVGTVYEFNLPAAKGITCINVENGPSLTVSYN